MNIIDQAVKTIHQYISSPEAIDCLYDIDKLYLHGLRNILSRNSLLDVDHHFHSSVARVHLLEYLEYLFGYK